MTYGHPITRVNSLLALVEHDAANLALRKEVLERFFAAHLRFPEQCPSDASTTDRARAERIRRDPYSAFVAGDELLRENPLVGVRAFCEFPYESAPAAKVGPAKELREYT